MKAGPSTGGWEGVRHGYCPECLSKSGLHPRILPSRKSKKLKLRIFNAVCTLLLLALMYYAGWQMRGAVETCAPKATHAQ
jgi:hypothetical protein